MGPYISKTGTRDLVSKSLAETTSMRCELFQKDWNSQQAHSRQVSGNRKRVRIDHSSQQAKLSSLRPWWFFFLFQENRKQSRKHAKTALTASAVPGWRRDRMTGPHIAGSHNLGRWWWSRGCSDPGHSGWHQCWLAESHTYRRRPS